MLKNSTASAKGKKRRHLVAAAVDLPPGQRKIISINGREIGVFNIDGYFYALRNTCPHKGGPLCQGRLRPLVISTGVYQIGHQQENQILKCPWHQWEFDIQTGRALFDDKLRVKTYTVRQEGKNVILYL
jgi:nitrite reductase (NADH) small subunit